jgi:Holliday junction DNA helicase RuvA
MIASLHGTLLRIQPPDVLVVEVGGVGFKVFVPATVLDTLDGVGRSVFLHTHLLVREDALTLYGFATEEQRALFELLLSVSGVGPRVALALLAALSLDLLRQAVQHEQAELLSRVRGVGKKTAEKIIFALKDKLGPDLGLSPLAPLVEGDTEVLAALTTLGYSVVEAQAALQSVPKGQGQTTEERLRLALKYFATP